MSTHEKEKTLTAIAIAAVATALFILSGCAPQQRGHAVQKPPPVVQPQAPQVAEVAVPVPPPVVQQAEIQPPPRQERTHRRIETMEPGGKILLFKAGKKHVLTCPTYGTLTVRFPMGEKILVHSTGNSGEWMVDKSSMGLDVPIGFVVIKRVPIAASTELHVHTDAETYQFLLIPQSNGVSKQHASLFTVVNPETEARQAEYQQRHAEAREQERRAYEIRAPRLDAEHVRFYGVSGDPVLWKPVNVVGDHRHTVIQLPASTGADLPMMTVVESGKEMRVNTRTLPEENGMGPRIVVDQAFSEARLIGVGGMVSIIGR